MFVIYRSYFGKWIGTLNYGKLVIFLSVIDLQNYPPVGYGNSHRLSMAKSYFRNFKNTHFRNDSHKY